MSRCVRCERVQRLGRCHHDRLVLVERRVEEDRHAGQAVELLDQPVVARIDVALDGLDAAGAVDVSDGRNQLALLRARVVDEHHEGRCVALEEPVTRRLQQDRGCERAERFAVFRARIERLLRLCAPRVGDDRAMAERARAELHPALEPADDVARHDPLGEQRQQRVVLEPFCRKTRLLDRVGDLGVVVLGSRECMPHHEATRLSKLLVPDDVRGSHGGARVARRGRDVELLEPRLVANAAVRHGVERHATREAEPALPGALLQPVDHVEVDLFEPELQRRRDVVVVRRELGGRVARRPQLFDELVREDGSDARRSLVPRHVHAFLVVREVVEVEREQVAARLQRIAHRAHVRLGVAVRREPHHLPLVSVVEKAEPLCQCEVEDSERVREEHAIDHVVRVAVPDGGHGRCEVAECVDREDRGLVERRHEERARDMCLVVLDVVDLCANRGGVDPERVGERRLDIARLRRMVEARLEIARARTVADRPEQAWSDVRLRVAGDGDVVELVDGHTSLFQAPRRGASREACDVLDAREALLLGGGHELSVDDDRCRGIAVVCVEAEDARQADDLSQPAEGRSWLIDYSPAMASGHSERYFEVAAELAGAIDAAQVDAMARGLAVVRDAGGRLFVLGVGGGAGHASHAVNDFRKLCGIESYAPSDNVSELTARTNDDGWETVVQRVARDLTAEWR